jgi:hypothetical protein
MTVDEAARIREIATALCARQTVPIADARTTETEIAGAKLRLLVELQDLVEGIDNAKDLFMLGGVGPLFDAMRGAPGDANLTTLLNAQAQASATTTPAAATPARVEVNATATTDVIECRGTTVSAVRARGAVVLSTVLSNNPRAQSWALDAGALGAILGALRTGDATVRAASVGALSALVRDSNAAQYALLSTRDGFELLLSPIREWARVGILGNFGGDCDNAGGEGARNAASRLVRRSLALLRHLIRGCYPDFVLSTLSLGALDTTTPLITSLLCIIESLGDAIGDDSDARDRREAAVDIISALSSDVEINAGVVDTVDTSRQPRALYPRGCGPEAEKAEVDARAAALVTLAAGGGVITLVETTTNNDDGDAVTMTNLATAVTNATTITTTTTATDVINPIRSSGGLSLMTVPPNNLSLRVLSTIERCALLISAGAVTSLRLLSACASERSSAAAANNETDDSIFYADEATLALRLANSLGV